MLDFLIHKIFTFYINGVLNCKCPAPGPKGFKARDARRITAAEMKYMRITAGYTWDRLQNKCTNCKGVKNNNNFGHITGIQEKVDKTCK